MIKTMDPTGGGMNDSQRKKAEAMGGINAYIKSRNTTTTPSTSSSSGRSYSGGSSGGGYAESMSNPYMDYLNAMQARQQDLINKANAQLDEQGRLAEQRYAIQKQASDQDYDDLRRQSEVNRYKKRAQMRETLSNRGALDSGLGRMETLTMQNNFDNALNKISLQQAREDAERNQAIQEMWQQIAMQKVQNEMSGLGGYADLLSSIDPSYFTQYSYNPSTSDYLQVAQSYANNYTPQTYAVGNGMNVTGASQGARANALSATDSLQEQLRKQRQNGWTQTR